MKTKYKNIEILFKKSIQSLLVIILFIMIVSSIFQMLKSNPAGTSYESEIHLVNENQVNFLNDLTYLDSNNKTQHDQEIFDNVFNIIDNAQEYILIDMFLFNSLKESSTETYSNLTSDLKNKLISKKNNNPEIKIDFITDPINTVYYGFDSPELKELESLGINVIVTDLDKMKDSNPIYSFFWRPILKNYKSILNINVRNPFSKDAKKVNILSYFRLLNFKANHRKTISADCENKTNICSIIMSANPHDGSSGHSNVAVLVKGKIGYDILKSEESVAKFSDKELSSNFEFVNLNKLENENNSSDYKIKLITESKIRDNILSEIVKTENDDNITIGIFYLSETKIIDELINAANRGVNVKIVIDPNKDAFGYEKNGIPNRQVANKLISKSNNKIQLKWYNTHGEQYHSKIIFIERQNKVIIILGSANFTRKNLNNYNLETNVFIETQINSKIQNEIRMYFDKIWNNKDNNTYTTDYSTYEEKNIFKHGIYLIQEKLGLGTF